MKKALTVLFILLFGITVYAQQVQFEEYDLANGLHVILHQDNGAKSSRSSKEKSEAFHGFALER